MFKISSGQVVYWKYSVIVIAVFGNLVMLFDEGQGHTVGEFVALNGGLFFTAGLLSVFAFRLWDVETDGQIVIAKRFNKRIEFSIDDIRNIDVIPNFLSRSSNAPPFVYISLNKEIQGFTEIKYFPNNNRTDEKLLIEPWKARYREWAQHSMKRRNARR